jgi:hypothetical protein
MKTVGQVQAFLGNGDQHVGADCDPDLRLDRVLVGAIKRLDAQMLLDPFEKQFDLPALAIQVRYQLRFECEVVGQERDAFATVVLDDHASQCGGIVLAGIENCQYACLIAHDVGVGSVHGVGVAPLELGIGLGTGDEESVGLMNDKQSLEIQVPTIEQVVRARLDVQQVQGVDLVGLAVADVNEGWDGASQVQQGVQFDSRLVGAKRCPWINRQAQVYRRGIEGVDGCIQVDRHRLFGIQRACHGDQVLREIGVDLPRPGCIGVGQGVARNSLAAQPHVIQPLGLGTQIDLDVAQRLAVGQLSKGHGQELIHAGEVVDLVIASVLGNAAAKRAQRQERHELRENKLAVVHASPLREDAKDHKSWNRSSNRDQTEIVKNQGKSLTYEALM